MPGLILLRPRWRSLIREIIEDLVIVNECSEAMEWEQKIEYLPFRTPAAAMTRFRGR